MIYDCFSYLDEDLLLNLRLNILDKYVDYFVIVEGNRTWQNNLKELKFEINKYEKFKDKIIYIKVTDLPDGKDPYLRENHQRNSILKGLVNSKDQDVIIISDLDEIPNPQVFKNFKKEMRFAVFKQKHFYYKFNLQSKNNPYWLGSRICLKEHLISPQWLRDLKFKKRPFWRLDKFRLNNIFENGGWHFCNLKKPESLLYKYKNLCETDDPVHFKEKIDEKYLNLEEIKKRINEGEDIIGRKDNFIKVNLDDSFPEFLLNNKSFYSDWLIL
jgi:beta-1,4-mannosyl-glycoprotein beta-1,4-N-acetylglucosaminyltransferase